MAEEWLIVNWEYLELWVGDWTYDYFVWGVPL